MVLKVVVPFTGVVCGGAMDVRNNSVRQEKERRRKGFKISEGNSVKTESIPRKNCFIVREKNFFYRTISFA